MPKAYRIKRYDHVSLAKRRRLLEEDLVPILDEPNENTLNIQEYLKQGDWLIEYRDSKKPIYLYKIKAYRLLPHLHLYIKHFIEADVMYKLESTNLSDDSHLLLSRARHLEALPEHMYEMLERYQDKAGADPEEKIKQLIFLLGIKRNILNSQGKQLIRELENGKFTPSQLKGMLNKQMPSNKVISSTKITPTAVVIDPTKVTGAISKAALEMYMKNHSGQLPTVKEFEKLTKRFTTSGTRRRRSVA